MSEEKTEQPTPKKLRDARAKGDVPKSQEVVSAAVVLAAVGYFILAGGSIFERLSAAFDEVLHKAVSLPFEEAVPRLGGVMLGAGAMIVLPLLALLFACALAALLGQIGFLFAAEAAVPKLSNLSPKKWFKRVFSIKNALEFVKNLLKVLVLTVAVYLAARDGLRDLFKLPQGTLADVWAVSAGLLEELAIYAVAAFCGIAALDLVYTRFKYTKDHMMSRDEVRREYKEMDGDPHIKAKRKQLHREMANQSSLDKVRKSKVVIVNPTHYAVAIDYERGRTKLPVITAKGEGEMARRIIEVARQENIPIMREAPLARALFAQGIEDQYVPSDLLVPIAQILSTIERMRQGHD